MRLDEDHAALVSYNMPQTFEVGPWANVASFDSWMNAVLPSMLSWANWICVTRFATWLVTQYFPNHIVLSAGTRKLAINLVVARRNSSWLPHCIGRQSVCIGRQSVGLLLKRPILLYFRRSFCIFGMDSTYRSEKGDSSK
jgi:hypothetical protein